MSLVNYSSDEEDEEEEEEHVEKEKHVSSLQQITHIAHVSSSFSAQSSATMETAKLQAGFCSSSINSGETSLKLPDAPQIFASSSINAGETSLKLPDASQLFASFDSVKDSIAVSSPGSTFTSAKRSDLNGSVDGPRKKVPRESLMPLRTVPDTAGGSLMPPQLRGRSNVATEDLDKLFTKRKRPT